jgi:Domain of unknown function (DUF4331)
MNNQTKLVLASILSCGGLVIACGDSSGTGGTGGINVVSATNTHTVAGPAPVAQGTGTGGGSPLPTLGKQIDRVGRPAINTATDETFISIATKVPSTDALRNAGEDAYNADGDDTNWATYKPTIAANLAVLDALDAANPAGCGNQLLCGTTAAPVTTAGCYDALAGLLAADTLWLTTKTTGTCATYLALEQGLDDCGGRRPTDDVIATTYTVVSGAPSFDDGVTDPGFHQNTFPYLASPH